MADLLQAGDGALRAAEVLLRATGGRSVLLRMPAPVAGGDEAAQMGLGDVGYQDAELGPCHFRRVGMGAEMLVSALAVQALVGSLAFDSAQVLFSTAVGIVVDGVLFLVENEVALESGGVAVGYRVGLRRADA